ncbi:MAG: hypothetical protein ACXV2B_06185 [Halobacteriota archaeon]
MKRMTLIAVALCLMMITTVGAGVVAAKQDENPRQAGSSHVYFYDVTATDAHGAGKLQINVDKHTFVFNGKGFTPSQQIMLKARAAVSSDYVIFATGKTTPSGNLHIAGTWEAAAAPVEVTAVGGYPAISGLSLRNTGLFVAKIACYYSTDGGATWKESDHSSGIALGGVDSVHLADLGVPDGALVKMHAIVVGGKDRTGSQVFQAKHGYTGDWWYADYEITGVTWNPTLLYYRIYGADL